RLSPRAGLEEEREGEDGGEQGGWPVQGATSSRRVACPSVIGGRQVESGRSRLGFTLRDDFGRPGRGGRRRALTGPTSRPGILSKENYLASCDPPTSRSMHCAAFMPRGAKDAALNQ